MGENLYRLPDEIKTRWASAENPHGLPGAGGKVAHGRKGMPYFFCRPGRPLTLARAQGHSGMIRRIWLTLHDMSPMMLRQLRLEIYWDDAQQPAVNVPLGDFFGMSLGRMASFAGALFSSPEGRSMICTVPMPFRKSMRVVLHNDGISTAAMFFYDINYTLDDPIPADAGYFHAWYNQETPTQLGQDYTVLAYLQGKGRFLGASFGVAMNKKEYASSWGGEGEIKIFLDGDQALPTLCGTGTEDYFGTGWCQGEFSQAYCGCPLADEEDMLMTFYRYHVPDPVYFHKDIRVTMQQIGSWSPELLQWFKENGKQVLRAGLAAQDPPVAIDPADPALPAFDLFERSDNWNSTCYFYLDRPENDLPALPGWEERARALPDFKEEELTLVQNDFPQIRILRQYLPNLDEMELAELAQLADVINQVVYFLKLQEEQLADKKEEAAP